MTAQQMTRDLAENVHGWRIGDPAGLGVPAWFVNDRCAATFSWNPFTSRDDAHELLAKLTDQQWGKFTRCLVPGPDDLPDYAIAAMFRAGFSSTPAQIAGAVWRATCQPVSLSIGAAQ